MAGANRPGPKCKESPIIVLYRVAWRQFYLLVKNTHDIIIVLWDINYYISHAFGVKIVYIIAAFTAGHEGIISTLCLSIGWGYRDRIIIITGPHYNN